ncbi:MAG: electron transfer flavoprotein subunit alpha/FixB family protein [Saprospiraceae bacterium]
MAVLVFIENNQGKIKKSGLEAMYFGSQLAKSAQTSCNAILIGSAENAGDLGKFGAETVYSVNYSGGFDSGVYADIVFQAAEKTSSNIVILAHTSTAKNFAGSLAVKMDAGIVTAVNSLPDLNNGLEVTKSVFSGKAKAHYKIKTQKAVLTLAGNSLQPQIIGDTVTVQNMDVKIKDARVKVLERKTSEGIVPLPEAELVVSAGRGLKGPENWGIIEELAKALNATTACSRPVADTGWRPHHEHVGQTGVAIKPNLYIAIGISGAIQHLAGVNNSKTIVVINKDPEAPFFKAADYGIVGDLFDVVPKLTSAVQKFKSSQ